MKAVAQSLCMWGALFAAAAAQAQIPGGFYLSQNDPNPFCAGPSGEWTVIEYVISVPAFVRLVVGDPDTIVVMRTLVYGEHAPGQYTVLWDGKDDWDGYLPTQSYPYLLQLKDPETQRWHRLCKQVATVDCTTATEPRTWGRIKALYLFPAGGPTAD